MQCLNSMEMRIIFTQKRTYIHFFIMHCFFYRVFKIIVIQEVVSLLNLQGGKGATDINFSKN